ncbi:conserved hypothetical protein [Gloeothece citriformis PCC 7424]|uniref:Phycobilisome protein n=1 Tax=Gloeothece citriformis (strain PCC 7424) TaxID=65393 RepID=B7KJU3_GLOC7|nr:hypothetical protein [Gloeothece citriformis]ACK69542.1 conserved hypothetical protein [Gloeothece citriformis PCC 7424]
MLTQLSNLGLETDGRYASATELQFLKDYLETTEMRIKGYKKIRDQESEILNQLDEYKHNWKEDACHIGERDITERTHYDMIMHLRHSAASMLIGDLDRIREGMLIWFQTIARSFGFQKQAGITFYLLQDVIKLYMTPEEVDLILPTIQLCQVVVGS